jgi:hypothetical protein
MNRLLVLGAAVALVVGCLWIRSTARNPPYVDVEGHVYQRFARGGPVDPVDRASVTNDRDSSTATTDRAGRFRLRVPRVAEDEWVTITARVAGKAACQQRLGPVTEAPVDVFMADPTEGPGRCRPN